MHTFTIPTQGSNSLVALRRLGYAPYTNRQGVQSFVQRIYGSEFPRFHLYVQTMTDEHIVCTVHIDQKAPVMHGARAHAGDYDSPEVHQEIKRLSGK